MRRAFLAILLVLATSVMLFACEGAPASNNSPVLDVDSVSYTINGVPFSPSPAENARLEYDGIADLVFTFYIPASQYDYIAQTCTELVLSAAVSDGLGGKRIASVSDVGVVGDNRELEISVGGIFVADYLLEYSAELTVSFTDESGESRVTVTSSDSATVYDVAHREYCDRSESQTEVYKYPADVGFSPYADLSARYAVLSSALCLQKYGTSITDPYSNDAYSSPYAIDYFDGVLTVSMKNGASINPNLLKHVTVDGEEIYFEISGGIIRVVLEVSA